MTRERLNFQKRLRLESTEIMGAITAFVTAFSTVFCVAMLVLVLMGAMVAVVAMASALVL